MASEGYHVFTYSIANFPTFRCAEQIRNDVAYHKLPVTVVANACLNFAIIFGLFSAFLVLSGNFPGWPYLALLPLLSVILHNCF